MLGEYAQSLGEDSANGKEDTRETTEEVKVEQQSLVLLAREMDQDLQEGGGGGGGGGGGRGGGGGGAGAGGGGGDGDGSGGSDNGD
jgi:hypothetical protein